MPGNPISDTHAPLSSHRELGSPDRTLWLHFPRPGYTQTYWLCLQQRLHRRTSSSPRVYYIWMEPGQEQEFSRTPQPNTSWDKMSVMCTCLQESLLEDSRSFSHTVALLQEPAPYGSHIFCTPPFSCSVLLPSCPTQLQSPRRLPGLTFHPTFAKDRVLLPRTHILHKLLIFQLWQNISAILTL